MTNQVQTNISMQTSNPGHMMLIQEGARVK